MGGWVGKEGAAAYSAKGTEQQCKSDGRGLVEETIDELIERVSDLVWTGSGHGSRSNFIRFLKEFRDLPRRRHMPAFVDVVCTLIFPWFAAAPAEDLSMSWSSGRTAKNGGMGFIEGATVVGRLVECRLLNHELGRLHLINRLTHHYPHPRGPARTVRAAATYRLFAVAGNTLLRGLLELEDVQACFEMLETQLSSSVQADGLSTANLKVWRAIDASHRNTLTHMIRNSVSSVPRGCSGVTLRRGETTKRVLEDVREKEVVKLLPKFL